MGVRVKEWKGAWWVFVDYKGRRKARRCASKKAAELARDQIDAKLKLGQVEVLDQRRPTQIRAVPTFAQYAERWLETASMRLRPATIEQYQVRLKLRLLPFLGPTPVTEISREAVRHAVTRIAKV